MPTIASQAQQILASVRNGKYKHVPVSLTSGTSSHVCIRPMKVGPPEISTRDTDIWGVRVSFIRDMTIDDATDIVRGKASVRRRFRTQRKTPKASKV
jgi:hypothetical protein